MTTTLDFKLGGAVAHLIATVAEETDSTRESVEARLLELLSPNGTAPAPAPTKPGQPGRPKTRYFVEGATDTKQARIRERQRIWAANKRAEKRSNASGKAELLAKVKLLAKTMTPGMIAEAIGKSKSSTYSFLSLHKIRAVGSKQSSSSGWWQKMTPDERSAEMMRRRKVAAENKAKRLA